MSRFNPIELQKFLKGLDYPASKDAILRTAGEHGADDDVRDLLEQFPERDYETPASISKAVGQIDQA